MRRIVLMSVVFLHVVLLSVAQGKFDGEIAEILRTPRKNNSDVVLFTGSSSIRMWKNLGSTFPKYNIVNAGFGGSQTSDLLYYADTLLTAFKPTTIFIYEGDNDLSSGKSPDQVLSTTDSLMRLIRMRLGPAAKVYFMSPKPSIARWNLKEKYLTYNDKLREWVNRQKNVKYIDCWSPLLDKEGVVRQDIFLEDGLHMNEKGYALWTAEVRKVLK